MRRYGFYILAFAFLMGQLVRIPLTFIASKNVGVTLNDLILIILSVLLVFRGLVLGRFPFQGAALTKPIVAFGLIAGFSLLANIHYYDLHGSEIQTSASYLARWLLYSMTYFFVVALVQTREDIRIVVAVVGIALLCFAGFGIFQAIYLPNFTFMVYPDAREYYDFDVQYSRLVSTFLDPNLAGCLIGAGLVFSISFWLAGYGKAWIPTLVFAAALILTYSRGAIVGFLLGFTYLVLVGKHRFRALIAGAALAVIVIALVPYVLPRAEEYSRLTLSDRSSVVRVQNWLLCLDLIRENPLFGIGFDTLPFVIPRYGQVAEGAAAFGLDGGLLFIFAMTGVFGFSAYIWLIGKAMGIARSVASRIADSFSVALGSGCIAAALVVLTSSFFTSSLLYPHIMEFLWIAFGILEIRSRHLSTKAVPRTSAA